MTDTPCRLGPVFYAIKVARRSDNATVYFGDTLGEGRIYKREFLDRAARYIDRERAEIHLEASNEIGPEIVTLFGVTYAGDWRGWHVTEEDGVRVVNGPRGETVRMLQPGSGKKTDRLPWISHWPDGRILEDQRSRFRSFASAMAARKAIERAMDDEYVSHIPENMRPLRLTRTRRRRVEF